MVMLPMKFGKSKLFLLTFFAFGIRIWKLGEVPLSNVDGPFFARISSALAGVAIVLLIYSIAVKLFKKPINEKIALWSAFWVAATPLLIVESRIVSEPMRATFMLLGLFAVTIYFVKSLKHQLLALLLFFGISLISYPSAWIFHIEKMPTFSQFLTQFFKLASFEFLFFNNDSFWWGGMRAMGVMLPIMVIPFLVGVYGFIFWIDARARNLLGVTIIFLSIFAALSPLLPESREILLVVPFLCMVLGIGSAFIQRRLVSLGKIGLAIGVISLFFVLYQWLIFWRLYTVHHAARISSEIDYVKVDY